MKSRDEATGHTDFPAPRERDLPPGRHLRLKEHLLSEIRQEDVDTVPRAKRRGWLRPSLVAGAVAAAVAAGLVVAQPFGGDPAQAGPPSKETVAVLKQIAAAARKQPAPKDIRDDQFVYMKSKVRWGDDELHLREFWESVDGRHTGLLHEPENDSENEPMEPDPPLMESDTNYRNLQKLPADPVNMLDWLNRVAEEQTNGKPFVLVGDLIYESLMPPEQAAALYLAAARIPGVELVDDAVDAAGRHGVAIAWKDDEVRQELIFDKRTKQFLGERETNEDGEVVGHTAVLERKVVDKAGERP
ncbi:CU044_5270 family protein [Streptomyces sp. NPDC059063]|uniref:CU044_5270 family protein n=1 Tax=unclassified Streptomyces TaxID=2593676 RepID=UPI0036C4C286